MRMTIFIQTIYIKAGIRIIILAKYKPISSCTERSIMISVYIIAYS